MEANFDKVPMNDLSRGWIANSAEVHEAIIRVAKSGSYIQGQEHNSFEKEFAEYIGSEFALGVASGTDAIRISLLAVGCKKGSRVITVANAGGYSSVAAKQIGCELIYCDVDPVNLQISLEALTDLLTTNIDAVIVTHLFGNIAPIAEISELCKTYDVALIEDCAQALGGSSSGKKVGTFGQIAAFSFYPTKNLGGLGDGGAIVTSDKQLANLVTKLRQYGWETKYDIQIPFGSNSRLDEIQAAVLRIGIRKIEELNLKRRNVLSLYSQEFEKLPLRLITNFDPESAAHLAVVRVPMKFGREKLRNHLNKFGVQTDVHYPILDCDQSGFRVDGVSPSLEESRMACMEILTIPCFAELQTIEIMKISKAISDFFLSETGFTEKLGI